MRQSKASFLKTYQNIEKSSVDFLKQSDTSLVTLWLSFVSGVNRRASRMLSHYLTKPVYLFVNTFTLHGLFSAEFHNTNTTVNDKGSVVHGSEQVLDTTHVMKGYVKDSLNSLDSIAKEQLSPFFTGVSVNNQEKITTTTWKCSGKCMKSEPSQIKTEP